MQGSVILIDIGVPFVGVEEATPRRIITHHMTDILLGKGEEQVHLLTKYSNRRQPSFQIGAHDLI